MNKFQVVVLAGGESSRFYPFNDIHKSFFTLMGTPIIKRVLEDIINQFDSKVLLVLGNKDFVVEKKIVEGLGFGDKIKCIEQKKPLGQGDAILTASEHLDGEFFVVNAQRFDFSSQANSILEKHKEGNFWATVGCAETSEPWKYGVLKFDSANKVIGVIEKPKDGERESNIRILGAYFLSKDFLSVLEKTRVSEYSLEGALDIVAKKGKLGAVELKEETPSIKYPWDIFGVRDRIFDSMKWGVSKSAKIAATAVIRGDVFIDTDAEIYDFAIVEGPAYIGSGSVVGAYCQVRQGSVLEGGSKLQRYVDFKNSILGEESSIHSGFVGDSIIGSGVKIGAGFITANKRLDRGEVKAVVKNEKVPTGLTGLGIILGSDSRLGIRVSSMPGTIMGAKSIVYPSKSVSGFYPEGTTVK